MRFFSDFERLGVVDSKKNDGVIFVGIHVGYPQLQRNCERSIFVLELQVFWQRKACRNSVEHRVPFQQKQPILVRFWWRCLPFLLWLATTQLQ